MHVILPVVLEEGEEQQKDMLMNPEMRGDDGDHN